MKKECKTVLPSPENQKRLKEITEQVNRLSQEVSQIIERTLKFPKTSPEIPVAKFTFTPGRGSEDVLLDIVRVDGDIIWVGCYQNPPGVCCAGPCPCD